MTETVWHKTQRVQRLNDLGFDVREIDLQPSEEGRRYRSSSAHASNPSSTAARATSSAT